jgi:hypothetical protein
MEEDRVGPDSGRGLAGLHVTAVRRAHVHGAPYRHRYLPHEPGLKRSMRQRLYRLDPSMMVRQPRHPSRCALRRNPGEVVEGA